MVEFHPSVPHPNDLIKTASGVNWWLADRLTGAFGSIWTVWAFVVYPLVALLMPADWQAKIFFISSGWIQLWALPLLNLASNRADRARQAKADADHLALTHVVREIDVIKAHLGIPASPDDAGVSASGDVV